MVLRLFSLIALSVSFCATTASGQSLSVDDLKAQIDANLNQSNEYAALLNDPDPDRAQMAMKVMLESGDSELVKIALDYGVFSPDPEVRTIALRAYFDTYPLVSVEIDRSAARDKDQAEGYANRYYRLSFSGDIAKAGLKIIGFSEEFNCYMISYGGYGERCFIRIFGGNVQYSVYNGNWHELVLNSSGELVGAAVMNSQSVKLTIPVH